jgi:hypothetical protein
VDEYGGFRETAIEHGRGEEDAALPNHMTFEGHHLALELRDISQRIGQRQRRVRKMT